MFCHEQENPSLHFQKKKWKIEKYRIAQDRLFESDFDRVIKEIGAGDKPA